MKTDILPELRAKAMAVAGSRTAYDAAFTNDRSARAEFLAGVIEAVRPALRAICSRVLVGSTTSPAGTTTDPAGFRGLFLTAEGPFKKTVGDNQRGRFEGKSLVLRDDGSLCELVYQGPWSEVRGEITKWVAEVVPRSASDVGEDWDVDDVTEWIADALRAQAKSAMPSRAKAMNEQAERLWAAVRLIRGAA